MDAELLPRMHQLKRRWKLVRCTRAGLRWAAAGGWVGVLLALVMKLFDRPPEEVLQAGWAPLLCAAGGVVRELLTDLPILKVALETDRVAGLKERLSTAVEWLQSARPATAVTQFMVRDASAHAAQVEPARIFPLKVGRPLATLVLPLIVGALVLASPAWGLWQKGPEPEEVRAVQNSANRIDAMARRLAPIRPAQPTRPVAPRLEALARKLREKGVDRQEAASRIQSLARQLAQERAAQGQAQGKGARSQSAQDSADKLGELARQLGQGMSADQARKKLEAARQGADPKSESEKKAQEAAEALAQGDTKTAAEKLEQAAEAARQEAEEAAQSEEAAGEGTSEELAQEGEELDPGSSQGGPANQPGQEVSANPSTGNPKIGKGKGEADFGKGTTNKEEKAGGDPAKNFVVRQGEGNSDWQEEYKKLYGSQRDHFETANTRVKGQKTRGKVLRGQGEVIGAPTAGGDSQLPAEEVFLSSKQAAEQAVAQGLIPSEYRDPVRDYFDAIDPRRPK